MQTIESVLEPIDEAVEPTFEVVHCPNCGNHAERYYGFQQIHTQCPKCDYLLTTCSTTGRVIEAYAPGIAFGLPLR